MTGSATVVAPVAELRDVHFRYQADTPLLEGVDLTVLPTDFLGILGPNGGGKTTLLQLLLGLLEPQSGSVRIFGRRPAEVRQRIGYVPQVAHIDLEVPATVLDIVLLGRLRWGSWGPRYRPEDLDAAGEALADTRTEDLARRPWRELSGGQRQRVLIARALAARSELLLMDEPTSGVDHHRERELLELLHRLNERLPVVLVTHDVALVRSHLDRAAWLHRTVQCYPARELSLDRMERLFHHHEKAGA